MPRTIGCILVLAALAAGPLSGQAGAPGTLSNADREVVRTMLRMPLVLSGLPPDSTVLLDMTVATCEDVRPGCMSPTLLTSVKFVGECGRVDQAALLDALVNRNAGTWHLGAVETELALMPAPETRALALEELRERFPAGWLIEVGAPAYSADGRFALASAFGFSPRPGRRIGLEVFERTETGWTPLNCRHHSR